MIENKKNKKVTRKVIMGEKGAFVSEIIEYDVPEDYEDAFKGYYPDNQNNALSENK